MQSVKLPAYQIYLYFQISDLYFIDLKIEIC